MRAKTPSRPRRDPTDRPSRSRDAPGHRALPRATACRRGHLAQREVELRASRRSQSRCPAVTRSNHLASRDQHRRRSGQRQRRDRHCWPPSAKLFRADRRQCHHEDRLPPRRAARLPPVRTGSNPANLQPHAKVFATRLPHHGARSSGREQGPTGWPACCEAGLDHPAGSRRSTQLQAGRRVPTQVRRERARAEGNPHPRAGANLCGGGAGCTTMMAAWPTTQLFTSIVRDMLRWSPLTVRTS